MDELRVDHRDHDDVGDRVRAVIAQPAPPLPGSGRTRERWRRLREEASVDVVVGRLAEAHWDADAILADLAADRPAAGEWWGVWAAEPPLPLVMADGDTGSVRLSGAKPWCSGAGWCSHALLTVRSADDPERRLLASVALDQPGVRVEDGPWHNAGMARSHTWTVHLDDAAAQIVGTGDDYLERPGFWHGGAGVAACWLGGAEAVARALAARPRDAHARAHLGAVDAALAGARWALDAAAEELDGASEEPFTLAEQAQRVDAARLRALRLRAIVESAAALTLERVGRALGAGPLCLDADHAQAVADLTVYLRQSHAERDLAGLGELASTRSPSELVAPRSPSELASPRSPSELASPRSPSERSESRSRP
ncbi:acyl-CoA dehydrogenase [Mariniluteicoccus flavus]